MGESRWTQDMPSQFLNCFTINQELIYKGRTLILIREIVVIFLDRPIRWRLIYGHDHAIIVGHDPTIFHPSDEATCFTELRRWCDWIAAVGFHLFCDLRTFVWWRSGGSESTQSTRLSWHDRIRRSWCCHVSCICQIKREHSPTQRK